MNNDLEGMWKEADWCKFEVISGNLSVRTEQTHDIVTVAANSFNALVSSFFVCFVKRKEHNGTDRRTRCVGDRVGVRRMMTAVDFRCMAAGQGTGNLQYPTPSKSRVFNYQHYTG